MIFATKEEKPVVTVLQPEAPVAKDPVVRGQKRKAANKKNQAKTRKASAAADKKQQAKAAKQPRAKKDTKRKRSAAHSVDADVNLNDGSDVRKLFAESEHIDIVSGMKISELVAEMERDGEEIMCATVQVSRKEALQNPKFVEADNLEKAQLLALECWRPVENDDPVTDEDEVIPSVVLYNVKRDGRHKARLVALGNLQKQVDKTEIYSPTVSYAANRLLLTHSSSQKNHIKFFDISNAFIKSMLDKKHRVFVKLPDHWGGETVRLVKALYGLRLAPRSWYDSYANHLIATGWERCEPEPGLFRKKVDGELLYLSIYVDDSLISCKSLKILDSEMDKILQRFPGKIIAPVMQGDTETYDLLGSKLSYNRLKRTFSLTCEDSINKILKKFHMSDCKPAATPAVVLTEEEKRHPLPNSTFPIRSGCGSLQYLAMTCRPDICWAVNKVAQEVHCCTEATVKRFKHVLRYLKGTLHSGVSYSPAKERLFDKTYRSLCEDESKALGKWACFSDADFAGCVKTLKSTSGLCMYYLGTCVAWSSKRQSLRAMSTCEAEYCSMFDLVMFSSQLGAASWFDSGDLLYFNDNKSALSLSKTTLTTKKSKHFLLRMHKVREYADKFLYVPSLQNKADGLTKGVLADQYAAIFMVNSLAGEEEPSEVTYQVNYAYSL